MIEAYETQFKKQLADLDPQETAEWIEAFDWLAEAKGPLRAAFILRKLLKRARMLGLGIEPIQTPYINTISPEQEPEFPGDEAMEKRIRRIVRWNAMAMVSRANKHYPGIGGHLSTYASAAALYEVGFNHFFRGKNHPGGGDQVFIQGHAAPGIYARAFLEGRLTEANLEAFRRETTGIGLSSYPHPRRMPDFWEFPTVSMGLGPLNAIYQARFNRYLLHRGLKDTSQQRVWCFMGDGEADEPEALGALHVAANEELDNLIFVVNCNLQRLDGPVRGNGKIIQELEAVFRGSGWNVIKVILGREWDELLRRDEHGLLLQRLNETVDGWWQRYHAEGGAFMRQHFFGADPRLLKLVEHLSDRDIKHLKFGGHDYHKLYAAYKLATETHGRPTAILVKTVKGWTLGQEFEGKNPTHQMKKLNVAQLKAFRDVLHLEIPDSALESEDPPYFHPGPNSPEVQYLLERRAALGGPLPSRRVQVLVPELPGEDAFSEFFAGSEREVSTTMAFVRLLRNLLRHKEFGRYVVPVVPDEARTFGMESLFAEVKIYAPKGQLYEPVDHNLLLAYREAKNGQILEEGITEAGAMASTTAAGTAYATHGLPTVPFYIFYSMFGFQRVGDLIWAFGDAMGRGFLLGATAGRTTLQGEGLQHCDGHSHVLFSVMPNVRAYDPAFAYEVAVIIREGLEAMVHRQEDCFYYLTLYNENYPQPPMPAGAEEGIRKGMYLFPSAPEGLPVRVQLFGSGPILREVLRAQELLAERFGVGAEVWSVTSYQQLRQEALECERWNRLHPDQQPRIPYVAQALEGHPGPIVAATDYITAVPDMVARFVGRPMVPLGTDGYGLSDTRQALRRYFQVDAEHVAYAALWQLAQQGLVEPQLLTQASASLGIEVSS
ncbi:pyruvate dehydrogenase [Thermoanaerobaculum aquaticum]|uniref:Pyruvate dehydrogenase E1 component n=1 Tax=Thermoanaerobaculum aquaticum TaxID=1312852 RepID=A0A062XXN1_9BACT|nr:pyruvate dehydrogenase (acetyl-transferring), homodimeric type [Thermoanaerobaculum aquaticum]KDA54189.1 pyruvate dehydrogenase [Thermoanaerobaculum aquaticum]